MPPPPLERLASFLHRLLGGAAIVLIAAMVVICFTEVVLRDFAGGGFTWYDELVGYVLVWLSFVGAALAELNRGHIGVEAVVDRLPPRGRRAAALLSHGILLVLQMALIWYGTLLALHASGPAITFPLPMSAIYAIVPLSALIIALIELIHIARLLRPPIAAAPHR